MNDRKRKRKKKLVEQVKGKKCVFAVYVLLRTIVVFALVLSVLRGNYENVFMCALVLFLLLLPAVVEKKFGLELPNMLEIIIMLFVFAAQILGELGNYYIKFPYWDVMLHTVNGFLCAAVGFGLTDILNRNEKIKFSLSPLFLALVAFCFSMTIGVLWEFFEFLCDTVLKMDMQKDTLVGSFSTTFLSGDTQKAVFVEGVREVAVNGKVMVTGGYLELGLRDTMLDLFVNFIGAVVFSIFGFFYVKQKGKNSFVAGFIPRRKSDKAKIDGEKDEKSEDKRN